MADLTDPRIASTISQNLTDIATKLEGLRAFKNVSIELDLPDIDSFNQKLDDEQRKLRGLRKVWPELGNDILLVRKRKLELVEAQKKLDRQQEATQKLLDRARKAAVRDPKREKEIQDHLDEVTEKLKHVQDGVKKLSGSQKEQQVLTQHASKAFLDFGSRVLGKVVVAGFEVATGAISALETVVFKSYEINNRFRAAFAGIATAVGAATPELGQFQQTASDLYFKKGSLGDLGMSIGETSAEVGAFAANLGIMDKSFVGNTETLITHGRVLGLDAAAVGELSRTFLLMGQSADDVDASMTTLKKDAKVMGVTASSLSKTVFVLGKNLLALAGPKWAAQMQDAIVKMAAIGISAQSLEGFTKLTDTFDSNAEAMAKLNTAFGTHINALQVFAEEDPAKRFGMITEQLEQQGKTVQNLGRQEKQFIAQTLGITVDEVNAATRGTKGFEEMGKKMAAAQQTTADWQAGLQELRTTLVNWGRQFDKVLLSVMRAVQPVLTAFGLEGKDSLGNKVQGITGMIENLSDRIVAFFDRMAGPEGTQFRAGLAEIAQTILQMADDFGKWVEGPGFPKIIAGFETIVGLVKFVLDHSTAIIGIWAGVKIASVINTLAGAFDVLGFSLGGVAAAAWAALVPLLPFIAIAAAIGAVGYGAYKLASGDPSAQSPTVATGSNVEDQMLKELNPAAWAERHGTATSAAAAPTPAQAPMTVPSMAAMGGGDMGGGGVRASSAGGNGPTDYVHAQPISFNVNGEELMNALLKIPIRSNQGGGG